MELYWFEYETDIYGEPYRNFRYALLFQTYSLYFCRPDRFAVNTDTTAMSEEFVPVARKRHDSKTPVDCTVHDPQRGSVKPASHRGLYDIQGVIGIGGGGTVYSGKLKYLIMDAGCRCNCKKLRSTCY